MDIHQQEDFYNIVVDGIMFTADKCERVWMIGYEKCSPQEEQRVAQSVGMSVEAFWSHYQPLLDRAVGWGPIA